MNREAEEARGAWFYQFVESEELYRQTIEQFAKVRTKMVIKHCFTLMEESFERVERRQRERGMECSAHGLYARAVVKMIVRDTKQCMRECDVRCLNQSLLKVDELRKIVYLCAIAPGPLGERCDEEILRSVTFMGREESEHRKLWFRPERVREWVTRFAVSSFGSVESGTIHGKKVAGYVRVPVPAPNNNNNNNNNAVTQFATTPIVGATVANNNNNVTTTNRAESKIEQTMLRALNSDPYYALVERSDFFPERPYGVIMKPSKMNFSRAKTRWDLDFELTFSQEQYLRNNKQAELRAYSVLISDEQAKNRILWPSECVIHVNANTIELARRSAHAKVTKSTRERPGIISYPLCRVGQNKLRVVASDARHFAICVLLVRERPDKEVRFLIPPPKKFDFYVGNIKKSLGLEDDADDDIIGPDTAIISVRCPIRMCMLESPARLESCNQACLFDVDSYLEMHKETRKWTCPCCGQPGGPKDIRIDGFLVRVMAKLKNDLKNKRINPASAAVTRIELDKECRWRYRESVGDKEEHGEWVNVEETRAVEISISGRAIDDEGDDKKISKEEGVDVGGKKREFLKIERDDLKGIKEGEEKRLKLNLDDDDDDDGYDSEEEMRQAAKEAAEARGNGGVNEKVPDIIVIHDSDSDDDVQIVGANPAPVQNQQQSLSSSFQQRQQQQQQDLTHFLHQQTVQRSGQQIDRNDMPLWQREIQNRQILENGARAERAANEARQQRDQEESQRKMQEAENRARLAAQLRRAHSLGHVIDNGRRELEEAVQQEQQRLEQLQHHHHQQQQQQQRSDPFQLHLAEQQRITAMHNGRNEYERSVMQAAQAAPHALQPHYYHHSPNVYHSNNNNNGRALGVRFMPGGAPAPQQQQQRLVHTTIPPPLPRAPFPQAAVPSPPPRSPPRAQIRFVMKSPNNPQNIQRNDSR